MPDDTVVLEVTGANGTIQWQESTDSTNWTDIAGATTTPYELITTSSPTNKRYFRAEVEDNCPNAPWYSSIICHKVLSSTTQVQIGDWFHGGIVFYTDGTGHGLIAPQTDQSTGVEWSCYGTSIPGAVSLTDGAANTSAIVAGCATRPIAASICDDLDLNGYSDWFLPAKEQLNLLYQQKTLVGGFTNVNCWSSSEYFADYAWEQNFLIGYQFNEYKNSINYVRCIRSFSPTDGLGKTFSFAEVINQPVTVAITTQPDSQINCLGNSITFDLTATGTAPTYQWKKNGVDIGSATGNSHTVNGITLGDEGVYTCEASNLCRTVESDNAELKVIQLITNVDIAENICPGESSQLNVATTSNHTTESGTINYVWSPAGSLNNASISNPEASPAQTTTYYVTATDQLGCTAMDDVEVFVHSIYQNQQLCIVTVDPAVNKNKIIWEGNNNVGTDMYVIEKAIASNVYSAIGTVYANDPHEFIDYASAPSSHSDFYKITVIDTCGNQSEIDSSVYHKTINLTLSNVGTTMSLNWEEYEVEDGSYVPSLYYIYRGVTPTSLQLLDSVIGMVHSYNDLNVTSVYYYAVGAARDNCGGSKTTYTLFSNTEDNSSLVNVIEQQGWYPLSIYPNPVSETVTIEFPNPENEPYTISITDITGKQIQTVSRSQSGAGKARQFVTLDISDYAPGIFYIEIGGHKNYKGKLIVQ